VFLLKEGDNPENENLKLHYEIDFDFKSMLRMNIM
jgi:hypothetical protein